MKKTGKVERYQTGMRILMAKREKNKFQRARDKMSILKR